MNGTSRFEGGESHLEDNIPKTLQRVYFPIAGYSEHERRENQSEKKKQGQINQKMCRYNLLPSVRESMNQGSQISLSICELLSFDEYRRSEYTEKRPDSMMPNEALE